MVTSPKKSERVDLEKVASQLAKIEILPITADDHLTLRATAKFTTKSFSAGEYRVSIGLKQAALRLDHPSFEMENAYQATLPKETWSQSWKNRTTSHIGGSVKASIGAILGVFNLSAKAQVESDRHGSAEQKSSTSYRIVSVTPTGWQIGTELGDPRVPDGTLPEGLEHCLSGDYLSGRLGEQGDGHKERNGSYALCVLRPKQGGNDPKIVATLYCVTGSLQVVVSHSGVRNASESILKMQGESRAREEELRNAFVHICLRRAEVAHSEGAQTEAMLSGELYLSHQERHAPILARKAASEPKAKVAEDKQNG
jgi:hypothetical protein